jgi:cytochrome c oxidase subunit 2
MTMLKGIAGQLGLGRCAALAGMLAVGLTLLTDPALAAETGKPEPWQMGLQAPASPVMEQVQAFHNLLLVIITAIVIFVLGLLLFVCFRFNEKANPTPSKTTHNTLIEIVWTAVPVIILVVIAIPSFKLLYYEDVVVDSDMTIKAIGRQWYWSYEYPDHGGFQFDSFMIPDDQIDPSKGQIRQLSTDTQVVLPVDTNVRILVTASDVLHSFALPAFGIKIDAIPGQLNETWVRVNEPGTYYGQCSELCGVGHADMPIMVKAVPKDEFNDWIETKQAEFGIDQPDERKLAKAAKAE